MAEYIERETMIKEILRFNPNLDGLIKYIECMPTSDVVPVVRCKDCKRCSVERLFTDEIAFLCNLFDFEVSEEDFCSYGERKADG